MTDRRPRIALTLGDVAGIGPELVVRAVGDPHVLSWCRPILIGHPEVIRRTAAALRLPIHFSLVNSLAEINEDSPEIPCKNPGRNDVLDVPLGHVDPRAGRAAHDYLVDAIREALSGQVDAIVTAPLSKAALHAAGLNFPGHTEILAVECGARDVAMMLYLPRGGLLRNPLGLGVAHVTLHTSLRSVPNLISTERVYQTIRLLDGFLKSLGGSRSRLGVAALNPHAGEEGLFGDEERRFIAPAVRRAQEEQIAADGPFPADALMRRAAGGEFDGVVAMYHDQGHIPLKLLGFQRAVNITLGLPIIRTSPSHGTAFDIAGKGVASVDGFREAIRLASVLWSRQARSD